MACENCKCHIDEETLQEMDYKRFNELLNEMADDDVCETTQTRIKDMMDDITKK